MSDALQTACIIVLAAAIPLLWYLSWNSRRHLKRRLDAQAEAVRILAETGQPPDEQEPRRRFTIIQGGLGVAAAPLVWLGRSRPHAAAVISTGVGMGLVAAAVTAIAVPAPLGRYATAPTPVVTITMLGNASRAPAPSTSQPPTAPSGPPASGPVTAATQPAHASPPPRLRPGRTAPPRPSPSPSAPGTPTPTQIPILPPPTISPGPCFITIRINSILHTCLL